MTPQDALKTEYLALAERYGYVPHFPTSLAQAIQEMEEQQRRGNLSPMGRDMLRDLKAVDPAEHAKIDEGLDLGGYSEFLNDVAASGCVSPATLDRLFCAEFPTGEFNACARRSPHGYLCPVNDGLRNLVFRTSLAVFTDIGDGDSDAPSSRTTFAYVAEICDRYLKGVDGPPETDIHHSRFAVKTGGEIAHSIRRFVVAHEVAHAELGHLDGGAKLALPLAKGSVDVVAKSYRQEFAADALAQKVLTRLAEKTAQNPDGSGGSLLITCGGVCFLTIEMIVSCLDVAFSGQARPASATHPPSHERIAAPYRLLSSMISRHQQEQLYTIHGAYVRVYDAFTAAIDQWSQRRT